MQPTQDVRATAGDSRTPREVKSAFKAAVLALRQDGCRAADYRLSGPGEWPRFCAMRLPRLFRLILDFPQPDEVRLLVLEAHTNDNNPTETLAVLMGLSDIGDLGAWKPDDGEPACCDDEAAPPGWPELAQAVAEAVTSMDGLPRQRRRAADPQ